MPRKPPLSLEPLLKASISAPTPMTPVHSPDGIRIKSPRTRSVMASALQCGLRDGTKVTPITKLIPKQELLAAAPNTISFEKYPELQKRIFNLMSLSATGEATKTALGDLLCCLPKVEVPSDLGYDKVFRVVIVQFLDRYNFCIGAVKRSCIHFVTPERKIIPFDTYNLFYRNGQPVRRRAAYV